jgi:hypothetical protein
MYNQYPDMLDEGHALLPDITVGNALVFLCYCADWAQRWKNSQLSIIWANGGDGSHG